MTCISDQGLQYQCLIQKIILFTKKACHAAIVILKRADRAAFCFHVPNIKSLLLKYSLQALWLTIWKSHLLFLAMELGERI